MSASGTRVTKKVETSEVTSGGQRRVVRTMVTSSSSGEEKHFSTEDMLSRFGGMDLSERFSGQSSTSVTRTVKYVTKEGSVTKTWSGNEIDSEMLNKPSITQRGPSPAKSPTKGSPSKVTSSQKSSPTATPEKTSGGVKSTTTKEFKDECLKQHNYYRQKHGVPPLKLSSKLCDYAQEWADRIAATDKFQHRPNNKYGENIYMEWSSNPNPKVSGEKSVDSWYSEIKVHKFGREPTSLSSGHFTQVIWKSSKEVGVAYSRNKSGKIYVVANYDPAGNMIGSFTANVPPPK